MDCFVAVSIVMSTYFVCSILFCMLSRTCATVRPMYPHVDSYPGRVTITGIVGGTGFIPVFINPGIKEVYRISRHIIELFTNFSRGGD